MQCLADKGLFKSFLLLLYDQLQLKDSNSKLFHQFNVIEKMNLAFTIDKVIHCDYLRAHELMDKLQYIDFVWKADSITRKCDELINITFIIEPCLMRSIIGKLIFPISVYYHLPNEIWILLKIEWMCCDLCKNMMMIPSLNFCCRSEMRDVMLKSEYTYVICICVLSAYCTFEASYFIESQVQNSLKCKTNISNSSI